MRFLIVENQFKEFSILCDYLRASYPKCEIKNHNRELSRESDEFSKSMDFVRVWCNGRYGFSLRTQAIERFMDEVNNFNPNIIFMDYRLIATHGQLDAKDGIDLFEYFQISKKNGMYLGDAYVFFFTKTHISELPSKKLNTLREYGFPDSDWIAKPAKMMVKQELKSYLSTVLTEKLEPQINTKRPTTQGVSEWLHTMFGKIPADDEAILETAISKLKGLDTPLKKDEIVLFNQMKSASPTDIEQLREDLNRLLEHISQSN